VTSAPWQQDGKEVEYAEKNFFRLESHGGVTGCLDDAKVRITGSVAQVPILHGR
jgi:hypothetical protein